MRLALSTATLPGRTPDEVAEACAPRGLAGIEIVLADTDRMPSLDDARRWRSLAVPVVALHVESEALAGSARLAEIGGLLEAPIVAAPGTLLDRADAPERVADLARAYAACGATLLLAHRTDLAAVRGAVALVESVGHDALGLAWEVRPFDEDLSCVHELLLASQPHGLHVRLHGGGPEQAAQDGLGLGAMFVQLALSRYAGAVALRPSDRAIASDPEAWARWLAGCGASGCGSAKPTTKLGGRLDLDVRPVEAKDRIDTVLGTYARLSHGGTLRLTVDHDPDCMYHLLRSTQPDGSFGFHYLERGPEVWRVDVVKR